MISTERTMLALCLATFVACAYATTVTQHETPTSLEQALNLDVPSIEAEHQLPETARQLALGALINELQQAQFRCSDDEVVGVIARRLQADAASARSFRDTLLAHDAVASTDPAAVYPLVMENLNPSEARHLQAWLAEIAATLEPAADQETLLTAGLL